MKKLLKIQNPPERLKSFSRAGNKGLTYVELIVVLGIFAVMTSVVLFNYGEFQGKVEIKNLASEIALKIVEAQKSALSGKLPSQTIGQNWKPSFGVYFDITTPKQFIYFVDLNDANGYEAGEALDTISIAKGSYIDKIDKCSGGSSCALGSNPISSFSVSFKRPDSQAIFSISPSVTVTGSEYVQITVKSVKNSAGTIKIYPSGRVQVN